MTEPTNDFERRVREALHRDGSQIRPGADGLDRIRERTRATARSRRRMWLVSGGAALATAAAILAAVLVAGDLAPQSASPEPVAPTSPPATGEPQPPSPTASPTQSPSPTQPTDSPTTDESPPEASPPAPQTITVPVYYLGETTTGLRLFREFHRVETVDDPAETAVREMLQTPPADPDYRSPWPQGSDVLSVAHSGGQITVDLGSAVRGTSVPRATADLMVQQLVYTVQAALQATDPVQILVEGGHVSELSGSPVAEPLARADAIDVQALTWVTSPTQGATVDSTFTVEGIANAFEATVSWQLLRPDGSVERGNFTTAAEGQAFSPYSFTVKNVPPGDYTLKVYQESAEDGSDTFVDTKEITVR